MAAAAAGAIWLAATLLRRGSRFGVDEPLQQSLDGQLAEDPVIAAMPQQEQTEDPDIGDELPEEHQQEEEPSHPSFPSGSRVRFHSLQRAPQLNGTFGVVLRYEQSSERFVVRKEVACVDEVPTVTVKGVNLSTAPAHRTLADVQALIDAAPAGARVALPRGKVGEAVAVNVIGASDGQAAAVPDASVASGTLVLPRAITLCGVGSRHGGTDLACCIQAGDECEGELLELCGLHCHGTPSTSGGAVVDIAPRDIQRVVLRDVSISAPQVDAATANSSASFVGCVGLYLDEISRKVPRDAEGGPSGRVTLEDCWVRGGKTGIVINAVGVRMRRCRVSGAGGFGIRASATIAIEGCTIGGCASAARVGGGILSRTSVVEVRSANGMNENRVQRDQADRGYAGYQKVDCRGCPAGRCNCTALMALAMMNGESLIKWDQSDPSRPEGRWQKLGWEMG